MDQHSDNKEAKVLLQSAESPRVRIVEREPTENDYNNIAAKKANKANGVTDGKGLQDDSATRGSYQKMELQDSKSGKFKASVVHSDPRVYGISKISRFFYKGIKGDSEQDLTTVGLNGQPFYRTTPRRWIMLTVFALYSMSNAFQWISYGIIADKVMAFYDVSAMTVDWLSMIYMLTYIPLVFPATWLLDKKGLRLVALIGSFGNFVGSAVKCFSTVREGFVVTFIGQTISAISQIFILGLPARLAAVWFGSKEVSLATAIGCFGNQLGVALGFLLPPILVPTPDNATLDALSAKNMTQFDLHAQNLSTMFYGSTAINGFLFLVVLFIFQDAPRYPPSPAQAAILAEAAQATYKDWIFRLAKNLNFIVLLLSYGINVGAFYAISTLLNQCILYYFQDEHENAGRIGLTIVLSGLVGSVIGGLWLSWSGNYKTTTFLIYLLSFLSMIVYTITLGWTYLWVVFVVAACLGFFMTGYLPVGFEFAAEITYPAPEGTSSGLLNCSAQIFGFILTTLMGVVLNNSDPTTANGMIAGWLFVGTVMTYFIKSDLRRTNVNTARAADHVFVTGTEMIVPAIHIENIQMVESDIKHRQDSSAVTIA